MLKYTSYYERYPHAFSSDYTCKTQGDTSYRGVLIHFTASPRGEPWKLFSWANEKGYCFNLIEEDGRFYQSHSFKKWGWHAGKASHPKLGSEVSKFLIGIEITAAGLLTVDRVVSTTDRPGVCIVRGRAWFDKDPRNYEARYNDGRYGPDKGWYEAFTIKQEEALMKFLNWASATFRDFDPDLILGHHEVSPGRKNDPEAALSVPVSEIRHAFKASKAAPQS